MGQFNKGDGGFMDAIRCDEQEYLIWKWHPKGSDPDESRRANSIRWGSSLRVREGSVAVFVYSKADGSTQDYIEGPYDGLVETNNFPVLASIIGAAYDGDSPFQAEVYFINLAQIIQLKFGVPFFDAFDPRFTDFGVPTAVRGSVTFRIADYLEFIKLHRLDSFDMDDFRRQVKDVISRSVKSVVANAPSEYGIPLLQIERRIDEINGIVEGKLKTELGRDFGVEVARVDIGEIEQDKESEGYKKLQSVTQNKAAVITQTIANIGTTLSTHRSGGGNIKAAAKRDNSASGEGAKKPGGGILGAIGGIGKKRTTPPPIPNAGYYVAQAGQQAGPFDMEALSKMAAEGELAPESLVWKEGMKEWRVAGKVKDLAALFE